MKIEEFLRRLNSVRQSGNGWMARCPGHDDRVRAYRWRQEAMDGFSSSVGRAAGQSPFSRPWVWPCGISFRIPYPTLLD